MGGPVKCSHLADNVVDFCQNLLESRLHVRPLQGRRLDERQSLLLAEGAGVLRFHRAQVPQVALVSNQHDDL
eukprot:3712983-Pyramimonas_sp.AAC.2